MNLSEELEFRGFVAETTIKDPAELDARASKKFFIGFDPSADSLTIGNLAAIMMAACFVRHGYQPYLLVGGATGQIGDPKETSERSLKTLSEINHNKSCIKAQLEPILQAGQESTAKITLLDNYDWFKDIKYLDFLREVGKVFSMTQLLDRQFVQARIGEGGCGISYAEFSYTLIQGYDFLYLFRKYGIDLQLCGADQFGNCSSGIHLIRRLENAVADAWSTPLIIDPATGRKFGKSEGNAIWLASQDHGSGNFTSVFDFYQFWLNQSDLAVPNLLKIYTLYDKAEIEQILAEQAAHPEKRRAQQALASGATAVVHGADAAEEVRALSEALFLGTALPGSADFSLAQKYLAKAKIGDNLFDSLVATQLASSKSEARKLAAAGAISANGEKVSADYQITQPTLLKRGKNKFAIVSES